MKCNYCGKESKTEYCNFTCRRLHVQKLVEESNKKHSKMFKKLAENPVGEIQELKNNLSNLTEYFEDIRKSSR